MFHSAFLSSHSSKSLLTHPLEPDSIHLNSLPSSLNWINYSHYYLISHWSAFLILLRFQCSIPGCPSLAVPVSALRSGTWAGQLLYVWAALSPPPLHSDFIPQPHLMTLELNYSGKKGMGIWHSVYFDIFEKLQSHNAPWDIFVHLCKLSLSLLLFL